MAHRDGADDTRRQVEIVDLGVRDAPPRPSHGAAPGTASDAASGAFPGATSGTPTVAGTDTAPPASATPRRRPVYVATAVTALLILAANLMPRGDAAPSAAKAAQGQDRALSVCEAVAFANTTGGLPPEPTVLPRRAIGYFAFLEPASRSAVVSGLSYEDGTISLCRPVGEPGSGSPQPGQRELPVLGKGESYAYEVGASGLVLIGERATDGTVTRYAGVVD